jgi:hypothetical protein
MEQLQLRGYHVLKKDPALQSYSACDTQHVKGASMPTNSITVFCSEIMYMNAMNKIL